MVVNGSSGERYNLNRKMRRAGRTYTEYPILGSGGYIARIFDRSLRKPVVEAELKEAVYVGNYYEDEQPLNVLYFHNKFIGFLYKGEFDNGIPVSDPEEMVDEGYTYGKSNNINMDSEMFAIALQVAAGVVAAVIGWFIIYPAYQKTMDSHMAEFTSLVQDLIKLNYHGVPAIITGIILQVAALVKGQKYLNSLIMMTTASFVSNMLGIAVFTLLFMGIVFLIQGAITFVMKYLVIIILVIVAFLWIKMKFFRRQFR